MSMNVILIAGFMLVMLIVFVIVLSVFGDAAENKQKSLDIIKGGKRPERRSDHQSDAIRNKMDLHKKLKDRDNQNKGKRESYTILLQRAGLPIETKHFFIVSAVIGTLALLVSLMLKQSILMCGLITIIVGLGLPRFVVHFLTKRRQKKFVDDMADVLESMVRMLKAGMPIGEAISMVSREYTGPVGEEMTIIYDEQRVGTSLPEAVLRASVRMPITEMKMLATAIAIQQQTGAALSDVLQNLASLLRARTQLKRKVVALSAEAKYTSIIIGSLPVLVSGGMYALNPDYIGLLFTDSFGRMLLSGAVGWMVIGIMFMKKMVNFRV